MVFNPGDVIYNALYPLTAPDIIFGPEDESFHPFPVSGDEGDLKFPKNSLSDWNCKDPTRLLSLILELRFAVLKIENLKLIEFTNVGYARFSCCLLLAGNCI